jgi:Zn-dependent metalloprotease
VPTSEQQASFAELAARQQIERTLWPAGVDCPRFVHGRLSPAAQLAPTAIVERFLARHGAIYGLNKTREYPLVSLKQDSSGNRHVDIERTAGEHRIYPTRMSFWIDATGVIRRIKAHWPLVRRPRRPKGTIDIERALKLAGAARKHARLLGFARKPRLEYRIVVAKSRSKRRAATAVLAWNFIARFAGRGPATEGFVVSAEDGTLLLRYVDEDEVATTTSAIGINDADETALTPARTIDVDDPGGGAALTLLDTTRTPQIETRDMATATSTSAAYSLCADDDGDGAFEDITNAPRSASNRPEVDAHYNTGLIHDYYARAVTVNGIALFGRDGWNNDVAEPWINLVHYSVDSQSSAFTRTDRLTYHGDGDGTDLTYKPTLDTCTHEWAHGVQMTEVTGGTNPNGGFDGTAGENFVLKEAMADMVAASLSRDSGWRMGAEFEDDAAMAGATFSSTGSRYRGLQRPSDFGQPDHYYATGDTTGIGYAGAPSDYSRCGILDKAAFLIAMGGTHPSAASDAVTYPPIPVYGIGVTKFENILDYTLNNLSGPADLFLDFRQDMIDAANALYPGGCEASTVAKAFDAVGVYESGSTPPARPSGPDPMITPWGATLDDPPYWQTPDIYVKDAADNIAAPLKGQVNRLFALVTNIGDADAIGVSVSFSYAPYGAGTSNNTTLAIDTVVIDVPTATSVEVEVAWDLSDLTEDNGGTWPLPLGDFDHFCVKVDLTLGDDVDPCNNHAQNNFSGVADADGDMDGETRFIVANPKREARWVALLPHGKWPRDWTVDLDVGHAVRDRGRALAAVAKAGVHVPPWVGEERDAVVLPMRGSEAVAAKLRWRRRSVARYDGPVDGRVVAEANGGDTRGQLLATIRTLRLRNAAFTAEIRGHVRRQGESVAVVRGALSGNVDRKTGAFAAEFAGHMRRRGEARAAKFRVNGRLAAVATLGAVVQTDDETQGLELGIPLLGRYREQRPTRGLKKKRAGRATRARARARRKKAPRRHRT